MDWFSARIQTASYNRALALRLSVPSLLLPLLPLPPPVELPLLTLDDGKEFTTVSLFGRKYFSEGQLFSASLECLYCRESIHIKIYFSISHLTSYTNKHFVIDLHTSASPWTQHLFYQGRVARPPWHIERDRQRNWFLPITFPPSHCRGELLARTRVVVLLEYTYQQNRHMNKL